MGNPKFAAYQARIDAGGGLTAREWDHWADIFKQLDPDDYAAYQAKVRHDMVMADARKTLSTDDLQALLAERTAR
jgi:hypothetical protein